MRVILLSAMFTFLASTAQAELLQEDWTPEAKLWLARAMVSEAGWVNEAEHVAIAYVLAWRFDQLRSRFPRFQDLIRAYCAGFSMPASRLKGRRIWIRSLEWGSKEQPLGWPEGADWKMYQPHWEEVQRRVERFANGEFRNPCPSANHFGAVTDSPGHNWELIQCRRPTHNRFWSSL